MNFKRLLFFCCVLILAGQLCNAQVFNNFKASEGLAKSKEQAGIAGISDPCLTGVFTSSALTFSISGTNFNVEIDFAKGTASVWGYMYGEKSNLKKMKFIGVINSSLLGGYYATEIDPSEVLKSGYPVNLDTTLENIPFLDSDLMAAEMLRDQDLKDMIAVSNSSKNMGFAFINTDLGNLKNKAMWLVDVSLPDKTTRTCMLAVVDKEKYCEDRSIISVEEIASASGIVACPNPAKDIVNLKIDADSRATAGITGVFDCYGRRMPDTFNSAMNTIDVGGFAPGLYYALVASGRTMMVPFSVTR